MYKNIFVFLFLISSGLSNVVIPDEITSLLSLLLANIPPIKKGTDSRIGFGYSFGPFADFQVILELGPQSNTNKIGQPFASSSKRQAPVEKNNKNKEKFYQSDAGKFLQNWAEKMKIPQKATTPKPTRHKSGDVPNLDDSLVEIVKNEKEENEISQSKPEDISQNDLDNLKKSHEEQKKEIKVEKKGI